ncbi:hypothetical protein UVI_02050970 [Ustilaginoidea virens]|uniref:Cytochrome P450 n=1 Tax=Ustilaginoidea virens TaxID=1159556 RepID=A0A1B5L2E1_USTVR|nr:hypothetical protein UVI_02050970 [Ustilaginoidea virens]
MATTLHASGWLSPWTLFFIFIICIFAFALLRSPLRHIPNAHWSSGVSPLWILWTRYNNRELQVLEEKHRQLGPILRLGPADLSVSCYENGARTIYNGDFEKPGYYNFFSYYARKNAFCSLTRQDHSMRRRRITFAYSKSSLYKSESLSAVTRAILLQRLLPELQQHASSHEPTDILPLVYALSLDLLTCYQLGLSSGSNFLQDRSSLMEWLHHYEQRYCKEAFWPQELPTLTRCMGHLGINMLPASQSRATQFLEKWLLELCDGAERLASRGQDGERAHPGNVPVVYELVKQAVYADSAEASFEDKRREIASELFDEMCLVLSYTIYYLSEKPAAQTRLMEELATLKPSAHHDCAAEQEGRRPELPRASSLEKLPYLSAILKESFRMRPTSTPLPRLTPRHRSVSLAGVDGIPPRTRVNVFQWFIHRNPDSYHRVHEWLPERWLEAEAGGQRLPLWPFGGGSRMCVGVSLTYYLMRYVLAVVYSNFRTSVVSKRTDVREPGSLEDEIVVRFERVSRGEWEGAAGSAGGQEK